MNIWLLGLPTVLMPYEPRGSATWLYPGIDVDLVRSADGGLITRRGSAAEPLRLRPATATAEARLPTPGRTLWARIGAVDADRQRRIWLQLLPIEVAHTFDHPLPVRVDDYVSDDLLTRFGVDQRQVPRWLAQHFVEDEHRPKRLLTRHLGAGVDGAFTLVGSTVALDVRPEDGRYVATRISTARRGMEPLVAANGEIEFMTSSDDWRETEVDRTAALLGGTGALSTSLHATYQRWLDVEVARTARATSAVGLITVFDALDGVGGLEVIRSDLPDDVAVVRIGALRELDKPMRSLQSLTANPNARAADLLAALQSVRAAAHRQADVASDGRLIIDGEPIVHGRDHLVATALHAGDLQQLERRSKALTRAAESNEAVPLLALAMGNRSGMPRPRPTTLKPSEVRAAFNGDPTPSQLEALEVALNTPDVAVIQGPPGTGKTRLLTALRTVLLDRGENRPGLPEVLLTGPQHDAVDNLVAAGAAPTAIPAARLGEKSDDRRSQRRSPYGGEVTSTWARHLAERIGYQGRRSPLAGARNRVAFIEGALRVRGVSAIDDYRDELLAIARTHASPAANRELSSALGDTCLRRDDEIVALVRRLRITGGSFRDDGPFVVRSLLRARGVGALNLSAEQRGLLNALSSDGVVPTDEQLTALTALKAKMLSSLDSANLLGLPARLVAAISQLRRQIDAMASASVHSVDDVLAEFCDSLLADPAAVRDAVHHYADAYALTCAFAGAAGLNEALGADTEEQTPVRVNTVIIDEAARANPLDLLITAQRSRRRVVLVGDQLQLPPMIEPEGLEELTENERDQVKDPLFRVLFTAMRRLTERDGLRRSATLTEQFRMHPRLGEFVSNTFYEPTGVVLQSARPESAFPAEVVPFGGAVAVWRDVPSTAGSDEGRPSRWRRPEVAESVDVVNRLLADNTALTIGVIASYAEQARKLREALAAIDEPDRLWVGTVDGSQGREFDIVVLSTVRSGSVTHRERGSDVGMFGHLANPNRLNVALSRARRLVVVVGDRGYLTRRDHHVPALRAFAELADREGADV